MASTASSLPTSGNPGVPPKSYPVQPTGTDPALSKMTLSFYCLSARTFQLELLKALGYRSLYIYV